MTGDSHLRVYDFHGLQLGIAAEDAVNGALESRLGRFARTDRGPCDVHFEYRSAVAEEQDAAAEAPEDARPVYESAMGAALYSESLDRMFIRSVWPIRAACDPGSGETTVSITGPVDGHLWALSHPLLTIPLIEKLKRRKRFSLHAAGVALGDKGLLIPAASGSGKSTLALALARAGFGFLGDDLVFLVEEAEGLRALAFPEAFDLTDDTLRLFPDLADLLATDRLPGWPKRQLDVADRFGAKIVWQCRPVALVFPRVAQRERSELIPMDRREALLEILPNILLTEPTSSQRHLDALALLSSSCACYRLETGTDFGELAKRLRDLLESAP